MTVGDLKRYLADLPENLNNLKVELVSTVQVGKGAAFKVSRPLTSAMHVMYGLTATGPQALELRADVQPAAPRKT